MPTNQPAPKKVPTSGSKARKTPQRKATKKAAKKPAKKKATKKPAKKKATKKAEATSRPADGRMEMTLEEAVQLRLVDAPDGVATEVVAAVTQAVAAVTELPSQSLSPEEDVELSEEIEKGLSRSPLAEVDLAEVAAVEAALQPDPGSEEEWEFEAIDWMDDKDAGPGAVSEERTPEEELLLAADRGDLIALRYGLSCGVDPTTRDLRVETAGWTALMAAARNGHGEAVRELLEAGVDPDETDDPAEEHFGLVQFQGMRGGLQNAQVDLRLGRTACHLAAARGHTDVVRSLIEFGCDVNAADHGGRTPLMLAVRGGFLALARLLVQVGASVEARDLEHSSALSIAARAGNAELVRLLLAARADVDAQDGLCCTPLMSAVAGAHWDAMRVLLRAGASVTLQDIDGHGILCFAIYAVDREERPRERARVRPLSEEWVLRIVHELLEAGATDAPDGTGIAPSQRAEEQGMMRVADLVRSWGTVSEAA